MAQGRDQGQGSASQILETIKGELAKLSEVADDATFSTQFRKSVDDTIAHLIEEMERFRRQIDPIRQPSAVFDPANPAVVGRFISLALIAQELVPLEHVGRFYGSGVYAVYYKGDFEPYRPISGTETPIYVGKVDPASAHAKTSLAQGEKLSKRLGEHKRSIARAADTLDVADFHCRYLVVQSGWQEAAERFLIHLFQPIWNNEVNVCYGIGKHGDSATTRSNLRSPWDTLHPGRAWASAETLADAKSKSQIVGEINEHLSRQVIYTNLSEIVDAFLEELRQI